MLHHVKGNLIDMAEDGHFDVIVHGCNCQNIMGAGIAAEIRRRHPKAYEADSEYHNLTGRYLNIEKLGNYSFCKVGVENETFIIVNAYTQVNTYPHGVDHFEYESFELILRKLVDRFPGKRFGFPYIGMGLAGGNAETIIDTLKWFAKRVGNDGGTVSLVEFSNE